PALRSKRRTRMLDKGIQAGHLEIVSSATRKNTRDVGVTFPTPRGSQQIPGPREPWHGVQGHLGGAAGPGTAGQAAGNWDGHKGQPGRLFTERRTKRNRLHFQPGTPGLVQAEDLKSEWRKENQSSAVCGPGPSWFEPWTSTKPWREPLREKNWEEQQHTVVQGAAP
ncbi:ALMS1 protein, partial [Atrichornis clamosus]|nr:ALMS1 protein [Atrichornis clamosus]